MGDVTLNEPPIIIWDDDKIMGRAFSLLLTDFGKDATLVYRPERPLPNGATVYVEIEE